MRFIIGCFFLFLVSISSAQDRYDAGSLIGNGQQELKLFNALYVQSNFDGYEKLNSKSSYFTMIGQYTWGVSPKWNIGFDVYYKSFRQNDFSSESAFKTLQFKKENGHLLHENGDSLRINNSTPLSFNSNHGLSHFGPKIRFRPVKKWRNVSLQQTLFIPIQKEVDGQLISFTQLFITQSLGSNWQLFTELGLWAPVHPNFNPFPIAKAFVSYFLNNKFTVYGTISLPFEYGIGMKYILFKGIEMEILLTRFLPLNNNFKADTEKRVKTFNLGFRKTI